MKIDPRRCNMPFGWAFAGVRHQMALHAPPQQGCGILESLGDNVNTCGGRCLMHE